MCTSLAWRASEFISCFYSIVSEAGNSKLSLIIFLATLKSASSGHYENQSSEQQSMSEGNFLQRTLRLSPIGDMQSTICIFIFTRSTNVL